MATVQAKVHAAAMDRDFRQSLDDLERGSRVPREQQVETQDMQPSPPEYVAPEDFDRIRLVAAPETAGRLKPRG
jgi:hypothetical protein